MPHPYQCPHSEPDWVVAERLANGERVEKSCVCEKRAAFELMQRRYRTRGYYVGREDGLYVVNDTHLGVNGSTLSKWRKEIAQ